MAWLHTTLARIERRVDALRRRSAGRPDDLRIIGYRGHASTTEAIVRGRVVDDPEPPESVEGEGTWAAVRRMIANFETDELAGVPLRVRLGDVEQRTTTDDEGYFDCRLAVALERSAGPWVTATVTLAEPFRGVEPGPAASVPIRLPGAGATVGIISDIDDTVLMTGAQRTWSMLLTTLTGSARTRTAFPGVSELYHALARGSVPDQRNPLFYVSSSPWNLYGFLEAFLAHRHIPAGPLLLRDLGIGEHRIVAADHGAHKSRHIDEVLTLHRDLDFVLIGDSGQQDPAIYAETVRRHPGRIRAIYIRDVAATPARANDVARLAQEVDVEVVVAQDSGVIAAHGAGIGLLSPEAAEVVRRAVDAVR